MFKLGLIINPYAGLGGSVGLKGSDGDDIRTEALARGAEPRAQQRMQRALQVIANFQDQVEIFCFAGDMGEASARALDFVTHVVGAAQQHPSGAEDTSAAAKALIAQNVDLILFAGGDGTARVIADAVGVSQPVLGVPSGVKMHSGVYANAPEAAGEILKQLLTGTLVNIVERDVKDIDEDAFRNGQVRARFYGTLLVPEDSQFLQQVKNAGTERDELAQLDVAQEMIEQLQPDTLYLVGPGSTTHLFLQELGLDGTLLGVDLLLNNELIATDLSATQITAQLDQFSGPVKMIITAIGGQGHILGRGNQQFTPAILRRIGKENIHIIAARGKILALNGRPLLVDTNDPELDLAFGGYRPVITGYRETIMYPVGYGVGEV
ncbi:ATP-NAD kinase family protein [Cellvibrio sp. NN19]|uniref:ATP-NAD kinase family protein n=1 Tax=Cellvibrio chitinivorans TaxID=3102792 RepID=UPI002B408DE2|nr:ATP-NAD kinase family protein [Cellvibrio sp. NN19]